MTLLVPGRDDYPYQHTVYPLNAGSAQRHSDYGMGSRMLADQAPTNTCQTAGRCCDKLYLASLVHLKCEDGGIVLDGPRRLYVTQGNKCEGFPGPASFHAGSWSPDSYDSLDNYKKKSYNRAVNLVPKRITSPSALVFRIGSTSCRSAGNTVSISRHCLGTRPSCTRPIHLLAPREQCNWDFRDASLDVIIVSSRTDRVRQVQQQKKCCAQHQRHRRMYPATGGEMRHRYPQRRRECCCEYNAPPCVHLVFLMRIGRADQNLPHPQDAAVAVGMCPFI